MSLSEKYKDMLYLEHHVSDRHVKMSSTDRAAQFAPFAALTGYEDAVSETARLTDTMQELGEYKTDELNRKMSVLMDSPSSHPVITAVYFVNDERKSGGFYHTISGPVRKIDTFSRTVIFEDENIIPIDSIFDIQGEIFDDFGVD